MYKPGLSSFGPVEPTLQDSVANLRGQYFARQQEKVQRFYTMEIYTLLEFNKIHMFKIIINLQCNQWRNKRLLKVILPRTCTEGVRRLKNISKK